ncbi:hypothetical protein [Pauljensenia hongkongensis]|uniref:Uncharacterized protein n=1 Tax=Pauljensenia hongkongensis TaxID=178339 RepID=A0A1D8B2B8_9ACTO|nr:hypothetical protein [Pauljensenia hongkongensis]AOS47264.1 hypothetical protein BH719_04810 [Pauljensenia hongkongensis]
MLTHKGYRYRVDSFDEAIARVEDEVAGAQELAGRAQEFLDSLADVCGVGVDRDERVRAEVDASGTVVAVEIEEDPELAEAVLEALTAARADAGRGLAGAAGRAYGEDSEVASRLAQEYGLDDDDDGGRGAYGRRGGPRGWR